MAQTELDFEPLVQNVTLLIKLRRIQLATWLIQLATRFIQLVMWINVEMEFEDGP